ncbi:MAG: asparagine synthase (glutamine-hydrolyzing), partial [Myxococcota bacterium]
MCGIAGRMGRRGRPVDAEIVGRMRDTLAHRGPDDAGLVQPDRSVVLAHRRLSIIDIEGGRQPLCNEDGSVWITFNGEIFNFRSLRDELVAKGHQFATRSDTEVLVHLYEEFGTNCVERLNGQFAFAIWDGEVLFCARDPLGIKPFYYYVDDRSFAFASEPRAFFAAPDLDLEIDVDALGLYLRYQYIPAPKSAYRRVRKLCPGESLVIAPGGEPKLRRYWDLQDGPIEDRPRLDASELREALSAAVERQLVADFDVGAFLSGGIDSSSVSALMQAHAARAMRTFTIGFPEKDERAAARSVAEHIGSDHVDALFDHMDASRAMPALLDHIDEPMGDSSLIPTYAVSKLARASTKVALSGDGGDELFAGYGRHTRVIQYLLAPALVRPYWGIIGRRVPEKPPSAWGDLDAAGAPGWSKQLIAELEDSHRGRLLGPALRAAGDDDACDPVQAEIQHTSGMPPFAQLLAVDLQTILADRLLAKVDRASMQASLEVRVPFLDLEVVRLAFRLAPEAKLHGGRAKGAVCAAMAHDLPREVFERKKVGFGPPVKYWFARDLAGEVEERLRDSVAVTEGILDRRGVDALLRPRVRRRVNGPR